MGDLYMDYRITAIIGIAASLFMVYLLYISPNLNSTSNDTESLLDDIEDPLELFRQTHLKEYVERYSMIEGRAPPLDYIARVARYIVIGKFVANVAGEYKTITPYFNYPITHAIVDVEQELTGNFNGSRIEFKAGGLSNKFEGVYYGDRVLVFIGDKELDFRNDSVFGDNLYLLLGKVGIYKIVDDKVYGYYYDGVPLEEVVKTIQNARAERIKDLTVNTDYVVVGSIESVEKVSIAPDSVEVDEDTLSANITVVINEIVPYHKMDKFVFFVDSIELLRDCMDKPCVYFLKHGTRELEYIRQIPSERRDRLAEYYLYYRYMLDDGVYRVIEGKAYGNEYPEGITLDELLARTKMYKG